MPLDVQVLEILRCPACRVPVRELEGGNGLECTACRRIFPIEDGTPVLLLERSALPPP